MGKRIVKEWATPLLTELDAMIDQAVNSMSPKELKALEAERKEIMANSKQ